MLSLLDRLNDCLGRLAAWLFFATGAMITYEVAARYLFTAPTIWAAELSQLFLIWGSFIAMAALLRRRQHIRITMLLALLGPRGRGIADGAALLVIAAFSAVAVWYGWGIAWDSFVRGRSTGTLLDLPNWWSEFIIPLGFGLLFLQCLAEIAKLILGQGPKHLESHEGSETL